MSIPILVWARRYSPLPADPCIAPTNSLPLPGMDTDVATMGNLALPRGAVQRVEKQVLALSCLPYNDDK